MYNLQTYSTLVVRSDCLFAVRHFLSGVGLADFVSDVSRISSGTLFVDLYLFFCLQYNTPAIAAAQTTTIGTITAAAITAAFVPEPEFCTSFETSNTMLIPDWRQMGHYNDIKSRGKYTNQMRDRRPFHVGRMGNRYLSCTE